MQKQTPPKWMPVFIVLPATRELTASITDKGAYTAEQPKSAQPDYWQRVGTARARMDGGFDLHLNAMPINGRLVMRPPKENESVDPTLVTSK